MKKRSRSVVVTGYIGLKGTAILAEKYREKISSRYPVYLTRIAEHIADDVESDTRKAMEIILEHMTKSGDFVAEMPTVIEVGEGGFLTAMWNLAKAAEQGFTLDLRKVPVKQETIEICELTEVNPYHLYSYGSVVAIVSDGQLLCEELERQGIDSVIIGYTNSSKAHILNNDGTESHLNRPEPDELKRLKLI